MLHTFYQSADYVEDKVVRRVVSCQTSPVAYKVFEINAEGRDIRQSYIDENDLPLNVKEEAFERRGYYFGAVEWPLK